MSFILDALKKSEAERQRQAGPTLLELRITHPRRRYPLWSLLVGALLAVNITVLLVFLLRRPPATPPESAPSAAITPAPAPAAGGPVTRAAEPAAIAGPAAAVTAAVRAAAGPAGVTNVPALAAQPGDHPAAPGQASAAQASSTAAELADTAQGRNPADYEPALPGSQEPARATAASPAGAVDYSNLPSISQISGNIPAMQLDLLDYSELSSERYALINMQRVREGDVLANGARVLAITSNGVAMDYRGQDFLLRPGGTAQ